MPVVINEFEVVPPPAPAGGDAAPAKPAAEGEKPKADPNEIARVLRHHAARAARVRAH
jgi:hypothetical protein